MEKYQERVIQERNALNIKLQKLSDFIVIQEECPDADLDEVEIMISQELSMEYYLVCLNSRIDLWQK